MGFSWLRDWRSMKKYLDKKAVGSGVRGMGWKPAEDFINGHQWIVSSFSRRLLSLFFCASAYESFSVGGCRLLRSYSFSLVLLFYCFPVRTIVHSLFFQSLCFLKADLHLTHLSSSQILSNYFSSKTLGLTAYCLFLVSSHRHCRRYFLYDLVRGCPLVRFLFIFPLPLPFWHKRIHYNLVQFTLDVIQLPSAQ